MLSSSSEGQTVGLASGKWTLGAFVDGISHRHIAWQGNHCNPASRERSLHRNLEYARHLGRLRDQLAIVAALSKEIVRVSLLKISAADFNAWNLCRDSQHGYAAAVTIVKTVN